MNKFCPAIVGLGQNSYYWTFLFYPQTYKVFVNLIGLDFRKCPVVCTLGTYKNAKTAK